MNLTKLVGKYTRFLEEFKAEQALDSSPLVTQCATDVMKVKKRITDLLARLDSNMNRYQELCVDIFSTGEEADLNKKMDENSEQYEKYATLVENIQAKNMDIFRDIHVILHSPPQ